VDSLGTDFDTLLTRAAVCGLVAAGAWALVLVGAVAIEARTGGRVQVADRAGCPPALRLWLLGVFMAVFAGVAPAHASDTGSGRGVAGPGAAALDGLPLPDRATGGPERRGSRPLRAVVVVPGDSLWRIVRELLPRDAADAEVAAGVLTLHAGNRRTIGADPDLLLPGQRLVVPPDFPDPTTAPEEP
jgi:hypothetical protein